MKTGFTCCVTYQVDVVAVADISGATRVDELLKPVQTLAGTGAASHRGESLLDREGIDVLFVPLDDKE